MIRDIPESLIYVIFTSCLYWFDARLGHVVSYKEEAPKIKRFSLIKPDHLMQFDVIYWVNNKELKSCLCSQ